MNFVWLQDFLALAANGHGAVWDYPWSVFLLACELLSEK